MYLSQLSVRRGELTLDYIERPGKISDFRRGFPCLNFPNQCLLGGPSLSPDFGTGFAVGLETPLPSLSLFRNSYTLRSPMVEHLDGGLGSCHIGDTTAKDGPRSGCGKARVYRRAPLNRVGPLSASGPSSILTVCSCHRPRLPEPAPLSSEANSNPRLLYPPSQTLSTPPRSERRLAVPTWVKLRHLHAARGFW